MPGESIFENDEPIESLFDDTTETVEEKPKNSVSFFADDDDDDDKQDEKEEVTETVEVTEEPELDEDGNPIVKEKTEEKTEPAKTTKVGRPSKVKPTVYGEAITELRGAIEDFMIYEGADENGVSYEDKVDYTKEEFIDLMNQNVTEKSKNLFDMAMGQVLESLSPTAKKLVAGELKGVKISEIMNDLQDYQDIDDIPDNPTPELKEKIVRQYYRNIAKERNKDSEWVNKQVEKIIDREELDSEFEDAKELIQKQIDERIKKKEEEVNLKKKQKEEFKKYHYYYVNQALSEDNLWGIKLTAGEKDLAASVLATFQTRKDDGKEKMGLTALIDDLIHSNNPKETYKRLVFMAIAGAAPDKLASALKQSTETQVTRETVKKLKVANQPASTLKQTTEKKVATKKSIFE